MYNITSRRIIILSLGAFLAACGDGSGSGVSPSAGASSTSTNSLPVKLLPYAPYGLGYVRVAPADGATISGIVRLEVDGYYLRNAELLPATGYSPKHGIFNLGDGYEFDPEFGWLDLDTTKLPNGPFTARISGFESEAGGNGKEFVIMSARTWNISNPGAPSTTFAAAVTTAPADGATVSGTTRLEVSGSGLSNVELLPANGSTPKLGVFNINADRTLAWLDFDSRSMADGARSVRISAYNTTQGQPGATEAVAMPARLWNIQNGASTPPFTATVALAPPHQSSVTGTIRLEVRGSSLENVELLPASGYSPKFATFSRSMDKTYAWVEFNTASLPAGMNAFRVSAFNKPAGAADAQEIVAMPVREWDIRR